MDKQFGGTVWSGSQRGTFDLWVVTALVVSFSARGFAKSPGIWGFAKTEQHFRVKEAVASKCRTSA